jgi:hypothetical protein
MPDRFWVGGTASWDGTAGTKWATTSGGAGGASVPTTSDAVFFTNLSTGTCTIAAGNGGAASINCTGFAGTITGTASITVAGSVTLVAAMNYTHTGTITFTGTGTITTAGKTFSAVTVSGSGITVTLADSLNVAARTIFITQGSFVTSGFSVTASSISSTSTNVRSVSLGSSVVSVSAGFSISDTANLSFDAGTSQINLAGNAGLSGGGVTYYNVSFTSTGSNVSNAVSGSNTFNDLSFSVGNNPLRFATFVANQTINGTLSCSGLSAIRRVMLRSGTIGNTITLTVANLIADNCDFQDITLSGAASGSAPARASDCGGNSNIVFPAPRNVYRVGSSTSFTGVSSWALTSGGTGSDNNFPLAQDTVIFDNASTATTQSFSESLNIGTIDASARTNALTFNITAGNTVFGSYILGSGITVSGTSVVTFSARNTTIDFNSAGKTITFRITINSLGGVFRLLNSLLINSTQLFVHSNGTLNLNGYTLTVGASYSTGVGTKNITFNGGTLVCPGTGTVFNCSEPTGFTTTAGTGTGAISLTSASGKSFSGGGSTYNCTLNNGGAGALSVIGSNTFTALANSVQPTTFLFTAGTTQTVTNWNVSGTEGNLVTIGSVTAASHTLFKASGTVSADYLSISRSAATGGAVWDAGENSLDGGGNSGWIFFSPTLPNNGNFFLLL